VDRADQLLGEAGSDTYRFALGDGDDVIGEALRAEQSDVDVLEFGTGIAPGSVTVTRNDINLVLTLAGGAGDRVHDLEFLRDPDEVLSITRK